MRKILLLGDSIRLSYQEAVEESFAGTASISRPAENCRFSAYTLFNLSAWLGDDRFDAIHWNNGQWDTCYMPDGKIHTSLDAYLDTQRRIAEILRSRSDRLIFATTTPVWPEMIDSDAQHPRKNEDIEQYNHAATELMTSLGVGVNDLHSVVATDVKRYICDDMVHLTPDGVELCASHVAEYVATDG